MIIHLEESRFLIISQSNSNSKNDSDNETESKIIAFVMFQFCWDDDDEPEYPVLYIMEIQVRDTSRGHGWGKKMMEICVEIAKYWKMYKIVSQYSCVCDSWIWCFFTLFIFIYIDVNGIQNQYGCHCLLQENTF